MRNVINQLTGQVCKLVHIWMPHELELPSEGTDSNLKEKRKQKALLYPIQATHAVGVSCVNPNPINFLRKCSIKYVKEHRVQSYDCYIAEGTEFFVVV